MSDIEQITWIELGEKLEAIVAHSKQRLPGEWPIALDDKFVELMNDACQYFPYEIASAEVLVSDDAPTTTPKNPLVSEVERLKAELEKKDSQLRNCAETCLDRDIRIRDLELELSKAQEKIKEKDELLLSTWNRLKKINSLRMEPMPAERMKSARKDLAQHLNIEIKDYIL